ncbi:hypothetical protein Maq22A_c28135 [Methylobacterium aquaticum]|uniref:Uncharacterized protein n=1 Tax=Methylobacterium aquaticum TaxID=270351 RepID=A0A1Y0ZFM6_9HYPH|nr:hypothetical protein Maq22A_c28135 [Methylobacterium aquaticum]
MAVSGRLAESFPSRAGEPADAAPHTSFACQISNLELIRFDARTLAARAGLGHGRAPEFLGRIWREPIASEGFRAKNGRGLSPLPAGGERGVSTFGRHGKRRRGRSEGEGVSPDETPPAPPPHPRLSPRCVP